MMDGGGEVEGGAKVRKKEGEVSALVSYRVRVCLYVGVGK